VLALQTAWILGTTIQQENRLHGGKTVLLETRPVDPRDLLRGDYVTLNYKISSVSRNKFEPPLEKEKNIEYGTKIYVALAKCQTNDFWEVTRANLKSFKPHRNEILVCGKHSYTWRNSLETNSIHVDYGIEKYYVAEGTGNPKGKLTVKAAVSSSGNMLIKEVYVDGVPYAEAMKKQVND
jgi:uncharacterized membrane-anchored protein